MEQNNLINTEVPLQKIARLAGLLYLLLAVLGFFAIMYVPSQIMVWDDATETMNNLLTKEFLFRTGIASHLISSVVFLLLAFVLYRLLRSVNEYWAKLMVAIVVVQIPIVLFNEALHVSALMIAKGNLLESIDLVQREGFVTLFLKTYSYGIIILEIFMGLWLIPLGQLVYKSNILPRFLGVLLIAGGIAYIVESLSYILIPYYFSSVEQVTFIFYAAGELLTMFWLLFKGVKTIK